MVGVSGSAEIWITGIVFEDGSEGRGGRGGERPGSGKGEVVSWISSRIGGALGSVLGLGGSGSGTEAGADVRRKLLVLLDPTG